MITYNSCLSFILVTTLGLSIFFNSCKKTSTANSGGYKVLNDSIVGKKNYLNSPYVTAGKLTYMVGHQNGTFPDLGWHIKGEMGGIWNHPIKLMDGFNAQITLENGTVIPLDSSQQFINFPTHNKHRYTLENHKLLVERWQFVPDDQEGVFIGFTFKNSSSKKRKIKFTIEHHVDLRPTWLSDSLNITNASDSAAFHNDYNAWVAKDLRNKWYTIYGFIDSPVATKTLPKNSKDMGTTTLSVYEIEVPANAAKDLHMVVAGSQQSEQHARRTYKEIHANWQDLFEQKNKRYEALENQSQLRIPDKDIETAFRWLKFNSDWLVREVPGIGKGIGAGIPDYPWWFGVDSEYALQGYMVFGQDEIVRETIDLIHSFSEKNNGNGRIVHEVSSNGVVFNPGNINETPQFASLIWEVYKWNGDEDFLEEYFPTVEKGLEWLLQEKDKNKNLFPDGFGMMEIHNLDSEMIDVASYSYKGFSDASKMAEILEKTELSKKYARIAKQMGQNINSKFWSESVGAYADFIGSDQQALTLIDDAIVRADTLQKNWAVKELKATKAEIINNPSAEDRPFVVHHNWVVNTPMEVGIADPKKAKTALNLAKKYTNAFGVYVTGIDGEETTEKTESSFEGSKVFSYTGAVMTLPTGVLAISENNYGNPNQALDYLKRMTKTFSYALPGSIYEVSPDYGMITQAWNSYSYAIPIVKQFLGIQPQAYKEKLIVSPLLPDEWDYAEIDNVKMGSNQNISLKYKQNKASLNLNIEQKETWNIELHFPIMYKGNKIDLSQQGFKLQDSIWIKALGNASTMESKIVF